jgi:hypothetical protein
LVTIKVTLALPYQEGPTTHIRVPHVSWSLIYIDNSVGHPSRAYLKLRVRTSLSPCSHGICKGTSVYLLTSSLLSYSPPVHMYSPHHLQGPHPKADDFPDVDSLKVIDIPSFLRSYLNDIGHALDALG